MKRLVNFAKKYLPRCVKRALMALRAISGSRLRKQFSRRHKLPNGYERIYFYHIRKTAGTSLNLAFFSVNGREGKAVQDSIWQNHRGWGVVDDYVFVLHNNYLIDCGEYYYAYSHTPSHELRLPPNTYTITILRDPVKRVISHYRNLMHYKRTNTGPTHLRNEGHWLGQGFSDFLINIPREHLMRQLYMFSKTFNVDEAFERVIKLDSILFTEDFSAGLVKLSKSLDVDLDVNYGKTDYLPVDISDDDRVRLQETLAPEYELLEKVKIYMDSGIQP